MQPSAEVLFYWQGCPNLNASNCGRRKDLKFLFEPHIGKLREDISLTMGLQKS